MMDMFPWYFPFSSQKALFLSAGAAIATGVMLRGKKVKGKGFMGFQKYEHSDRAGYAGLAVFFAGMLIDKNARKKQPPISAPVSRPDGREIRLRR
jgi:hypothetical protein